MNLRILTGSRIVMVFTLVFFSLASMAQEKGADISVNINKDTDNGKWYSQPWVWLVGAVVFIILLVALLRGTKTPPPDSTKIHSDH